MATWEDGPEYAPLQRPDGFSLPDVPPLAPAPAVPPVTPARYPGRPQFADPQGVSVALETVLPPTGDERNPALPFAVVSSTVTSMDSAWGAAHWSPPSGPPVGAYPAAVGLAGVGTAGVGTPMAPPSGPPIPAGTWQPPGADPWQTTAPFVPANAPAATPGGYPSPGTPQWFGPGPYVQPQPAPSEADAKTVLAALTPGLCIVLVIGGFFSALAPIMLVVALALSSRVTVLGDRVRGTLKIGLGVLLLVGILDVLAGPLSFTSWWDLVGLSALVICWGALVIAILMVRQGLRMSAANNLPRYRGPDHPSSWG